MSRPGSRAASACRRCRRGCRWIAAPTVSADALATASVAVVAGGVTLYEACALGTPAVALAVVPAQRLTTARGLPRAGAAIDADAPASRAGRATAPPTTSRALLAEPRAPRAHGRRARARSSMVAAPRASPAVCARSRRIGARRSGRHVA